MRMIRIRLDDTVYIVNKVYGYKYIKQIVFYDKDNKYAVTVESDAKMEELLDQALKYGYIDFSKERIKCEFE